MARISRPATGEANSKGEADTKTLSNISMGPHPEDERSIATMKTANTSGSNRNSSNHSMTAASSTSFVAITMEHLQRQVLQLQRAYKEQQLQQRGTTADLTEVVVDAVSNVEAKLPELSDEWKTRFEFACQRIQVLEQKQLQEGDDEGTIVSAASAIRNEMNTLQMELETKIQRATEDIKFRLEAMLSSDGGEQAVTLAETLVDWKQQIETNEDNIAAELEALRNQIRVDNSMTTPKSAPTTTVEPNAQDQQAMKESVMDLVSEMDVFREDLTELTGMDGKVEIIQAELLQVKEELTVMHDNYAALVTSQQEISLEHEEFVAAQQAKDQKAGDFRSQLLNDMEARFADFKTVIEAECQNNLGESPLDLDVYAELKNHREETAKAHQAMEKETMSQLDDLRSQFAKQTKVLTETLRSLHQERNEYMEELKVLRREHKTEMERTATGFETELSELRDDVESHKAALDQAQSKMRVMQKEREYFRGELKQMNRAKFLERVGPEITVETSLSQSHTASFNSFTSPTTPRGSSMGGTPKFVRKGSICRSGNHHPASPGKRHGVSPRFKDGAVNQPPSPTGRLIVSPQQNFGAEDESRDDVSPRSRRGPSNKTAPSSSFASSSSQLNKACSTASPNCVMTQFEEVSSLDGSAPLDEVDPSMFSLERRFQDSSVRVEAPDGGCAQS